MSSTKVSLNCLNGLELTEKELISKPCTIKFELSSNFTLIGVDFDRKIEHMTLNMINKILHVNDHMH